MATSQFRLLLERRFLPFFGTQALGAFNDNVYKNALLIIATYDTAAYSSLDPRLLTNLGNGLFILPFVLFSGLGGQLADRFDKTVVMRTVKACEVLIMALAGFGFATHSLALLLAALFLMGAHSTFFAPAKYGLLPQVLVEDELVGGNALLEMGTFLAILLGTLLAGVLASYHDVPMLVGVLLLIALLGLGVSTLIPRTAPLAPQLRIEANLLRSSLANMRAASVDRVVFLAILGISWFWFYGALVLAQLPLYAKLTLNGTETVVTLMLLGFSLGVGTGSLLCERLSGRRLEIGLVPFGSLGLTAFGVDLYFATPSAPAAAPLSWASFLALPAGWHVILDLTLIGVFGGLYIVPLYALMQRRTPRDVMARVVSANSIWNALFMVAAAGFGALLLKRGLSIPQLLLVAALLNFAVTAFIYVLVPEFLLRFLAWMVARVMYRLRISGLANVPAEGPALVVCNHVSFVDALVLSAAIHRPMRFVMDAAIFKIPLVNLVFRGMKAIPIASSSEDLAVREAAFAQIFAELAAGELVCVFPEGRLTADGTVGEFRPGMMRVMKERPVPVVPLAISGLWGSPFSRRYHGLARYLPRRLWPRVRVRIGIPVEPKDVTPESLRARVVGLRGPIA
ncbi:MAG TPA: MFS transporter [Steroidobacteraceae bacterium]|nr:MFS transporter [Steroidobacteraceae bacterium]